MHAVLKRASWSMGRLDERSKNANESMSERASIILMDGAVVIIMEICHKMLVRGMLALARRRANPGQKAVRPRCSNDFGRRDEVEVIKFYHRTHICDTKVQAQLDTERQGCENSTAAFLGPVRI